MTRRTLLGWLAALPGLGFLAAKAKAKPTVREIRWTENGDQRMYFDALNPGGDWYIFDFGNATCRPVPPGAQGFWVKPK